jgi:hypothetical protein
MAAAVLVFLVLVAVVDAVRPGAAQVVFAAPALLGGDLGGVELGEELVEHVH